MKTVEEYNTVDHSLLWLAVQVRTLNMSITIFNYLFFGLQIRIDVYNLWL